MAGVKGSTTSVVSRYPLTRQIITGIGNWLESGLDVGNWRGDGLDVGNWLDGGLDVGRNWLDGGLDLSRCGRMWSGSGPPSIGIMSVRGNLR